LAYLGKTQNVQDNLGKKSVQMLKFENPLISKFPRTFLDRYHVNISWNCTLLCSSKMSFQEELSEVFFDLYNFQLNLSYNSSTN